VARIGICLLNIVLPGLGLFRLRNLKGGLAWAAAWVMFVLMVSAVYALSLIPTFTHFLIFVAAVLAIFLTLTIGPAVQSWRTSKFVGGATQPWWSRWYAIIAIAGITTWFSGMIQDYWHRFYKGYYEAAESMSPSLRPNERFFADMRPRPDVGRGELVIVRDASGRGRVYRVVGLPGDRLTIRAGVPIINGLKAEEVNAGSFTYMSSFEGAVSLQRLRETLPGETGTHDILNAGDGTLVDDMAEVIVPGDHIFVLGDNRDRAADSRVNTSFNGVGFIPVSNIMGRPLFIYWSSKRERIGMQLSR